MNRKSFIYYLILLKFITYKIILKKMKTNYTKYKEKNNNKSIIKNKSSYYQKLYALHSDEDEENKEQNKSLLKLQKIKERKNKMNSLLKVFKGPVKDEKNGPRWPKVTHPKLPFSNIKKEDPIIQKQKIELLKPSRLYHDFHTIQWLRKKYSDSVIEKSVFSILPQNGKAKMPTNESERKKRKRKMMEYLESSKGPVGKEKYVKINPKYLYDQTTYDKIQKLKEIFLQFDESGFRKMKMNELVSLFNQNNIRADIKDLVKLFFKDKKIKKEDYMKLYLNFYQFLNFALTKQQDFRHFMRNIKEKYKKTDGEESKDKDAYLPTNLNLVLDYFINKGKERSSIERIEKAISEMDNIIEENNHINKSISQKDFYNYNIQNGINKESKNKQRNKNFKQENKIQNDSRRHSNRELSKILGHNYSSNDLREQKNNSKSNIKAIKNNDIEAKFEKINFKQLIQEFSNLFNYNGLSDTDKNNNKQILNNEIKEIKKSNLKKKIKNFSITRKKSLETMSVSAINLISPTNKTNFKGITLNNTHNNKKFSDMTELYELSGDKNEIIEDVVKKKMNENIILKMNFNNFEKYHDAKLALNATKEQIKKINKNNNLNYKINKIVKKNNSQSYLPGINTINTIKTLSKKEYKYPDNILNKIDIKNKSKQLTNNKNNSYIILKRTEQSSIINNKSIINNCFSETNNNNSKFYKTNKTFLNIFYGKSQLVNMSQDLTDFASKSKFDYVPPEFLFS